MTAAAVGAARARALPPDVNFPAEFHICAVGARNTVAPDASTAANAPVGVRRTVSPVLCSPNVSFRSSLLAAARGDLTMRTCWNPSTVAVTLRSVSGSTSRYSAPAPVSSGSGRLPGQSRASERPCCAMDTRGSSRPPAENDICTAAAFGPMLPSGRRSSSASGLCHPPPGLATRTGTDASSKVKVYPSGLANTVVRSERCPLTSTRSPALRASASAR